MFCFINLTPQTPPSVIHGWKATDLLYDMVKTKKYFFHPVRRQIFGDALKQTFYMISKLVLDCLHADRYTKNDSYFVVSTMFNFLLYYTSKIQHLTSNLKLNIKNCLWIYLYIQIFSNTKIHSYHIIFLYKYIQQTNLTWGPKSPQVKWLKLFTQRLIYKEKLLTFCCVNYVLTFCCITHPKSSI